MVKTVFVMTLLENRYNQMPMYASVPDDENIELRRNETSTQTNKRIGKSRTGKGPRVIHRRQQTLKENRFR